MCKRLLKFPANTSLIAGLVVTSYFAFDLNNRGKLNSTFQVVGLLLILLIFALFGIILDDIKKPLPLLRRQVTYPANPDDLELKNYWLNGRRKAFYVGFEPLSGRHMFRVEGINTNKPDDTTDLTPDEVRTYISIHQELT